jgi:hypothetical protein
VKTNRIKKENNILEDLLKEIYNKGNFKPFMKNKDTIYNILKNRIDFIEKIRERY